MLLHTWCMDLQIPRRLGPLLLTCQPGSALCHLPSLGGEDLRQWSGRHVRVTA